MNTSSIFGNSFAKLLAGLIATYFILLLAISVIMIIASWKLFEKANVKGWKSLIPIYNTYLLFEFVGLKGWYVFLGFIPLIGPIILIVFSIKSMINLAKSFGRELSFGIGLILLPIVFLPIIAFGDDKYIGPNENKILKNLE